VGCGGTRKGQGISQHRQNYSAGLFPQWFPISACFQCPQFSPSLVLAPILRPAFPRRSPWTSPSHMALSLSEILSDVSESNVSIVNRYFWMPSDCFPFNLKSPLWHQMVIFYPALGPSRMLLEIQQKAWILGSQK
jgi:hypothetical protein